MDHSLSHVSAAPRSVFLNALHASVPVLCGFLPLGFAFGLMAVNTGLSWQIAVAMSLFIYAGASQFLTVGMLALGAGLGEIFLAVFFVNMRLVFYGLSLLDRYIGPWWKRFYLIFGLTDEVYAILTASDEERDDDVQFCFYLTALTHFYWVASTLFGALVGSRFELSVSGLEFVLTCLFLVLAIDKAFSIRRAAPFVIGLGAALISLILVPQHMLFAAIFLSLPQILWFSLGVKK